MEPNADNMKIEIKDSLTCFICASKVKDAMMCIKCKKLSCASCIKKWFETGHKICPFCKTESNLNSMISLPFVNHLSDFFIKEIDNKEKNQKNNNEIIDNNNIINNLNNINDNENGNENILSKTQIINNKLKFDENDKINKQRSDMKKKGGEKCGKHLDKMIEYYCLNCSTKHCAKCLMINNEESKIHSGHKIISIEQKNKYNLDEVKKEINNLPNVVNEIKGYKRNIELENKIIEKKEEFILKIIEIFTKYIGKKNESKKLNLAKKNKLIKNHADDINKVKNSYIDALTNFVDRDDVNGCEEYYNKIKNFRDINRYTHTNNFNIYLKPNLKFYETDFIQIDINEYNETIGEAYLVVEGINNQLHLKFSGEAINEVIINLLIYLENKITEKQQYYASLIIKVKNGAILLPLNETMVLNGTLILGKTILKSGLSALVDQNNKCHVKLILAYMSL